MGEINTYDEFGQTIIDVVRKNSLQTILEIGSWDGTGSTKCFIEALKKAENPKLVCIELRKDRFEELKNNTKQYPWVECVNISTISKHTFLHKNFDEVWNSPYNKIENKDKKVVQSWYEDDMNEVSKFETGYLDNDTLFYDGVLIDGGEFFGYSEYKLVKDRTNVLFLDDYYNAFKTNQVARELLQDPDWEVIAGNRYWRNGYAVFKRKNFLECKK
jgi:hypothetical protein